MPLLHTAPFYKADILSDIAKILSTLHVHTAQSTYLL